MACVDLFISRRHQNGMKAKIIKSVIWMVRVSVIGQKLQLTWWEIQVQSNSRVNNYVNNYSVLKNVHFHIHTYITNDSFHTISGVFVWLSPHPLSCLLQYIRNYHATVHPSSNCGLDPSPAHTVGKSEHHCTLS